MFAFSKARNTRTCGLCQSIDGGREAQGCEERGYDIRGERGLPSIQTDTAAEPLKTRYNLFGGLD